MALAYINLSSKQYFNFMCRTDFERRIFHDSYREFQKEAKIYSLNQSLNTFEQMLQANSKAYSLHDKLNFSVMNTLSVLEGKMPNLIDTDNKALRFDFAELSIYASDLLNKAGHVVCVTYTTPKLVLHEITADLLILSYFDNSDNETFRVKISDEISINYEKTNELIYS